MISVNCKPKSSAFNAVQPLNLFPLVSTANYDDLLIILHNFLFEYFVTDHLSYDLREAILYS